MTEPTPTYRYRADVLAQLAEHGVRPTPTTDPERVHGLINDLYRYELRRMRDRVRAGTFEKREYVNRVVALRRRYPLVSLKPHEFVE